MQNAFFEISVIVLIAATLAYAVSKFRQPSIIGYILTGIIVGPSFLNLITATETVNALSEFGVTLLLFTVGLNLNPKMIKNLGKVAVYTGLGQLIITSFVGFFICLWLGYNQTESVYISTALAMSSTIVIMKLLSDKEQLHSLYGRIVVGFLLVQDIAAILMMMVVSSTAQGTALSSVFAQSLLTGVGLLGVLFLITRYVFPLIDHKLSQSSEILFLSSIAWCFVLASIFKFFNFSFEIGALLAGISLSVTDYGPQIGARVKPLRDFFIVVFFIVIGASLEVQMLSLKQTFDVVLLSLFVLIGDPLIVMFIMRYLRFPRHVGFLSGLTVAQVSEFSLIMVTLGVKLGHIPDSVLLITTMVGLVTIALSSYMISYGDDLFRIMSPYLTWFEPRKLRKIARATTQKCRTIMFGYNRIGFDVLEVIKEFRGRPLVIDYNPQTVRMLQKQGVNCMYGDADDVMLLEEVDLRSPRLFISTIPSLETTLNIIYHIRTVNKKAIIVVTAQQIQEALKFYKAGASYVLLPHFVGGNHLAEILEHHKTRRAPYERERKKHIAYLLERLAKGHELSPGECHGL